MEESRDEGIFELGQEILMHGEDTFQVYFIGMANECTEPLSQQQLHRTKIKDWIIVRRSWKHFRGISDT